MRSSRLEALSDGVLAIIITIMVLELHAPHGATLRSLWDSTGTGLLTYVLSFVYVGIYWTNHHHLFQVVPDVTGAVLWANLHLLFWLSLFPFTTNWMDEMSLARTPTIVYGVNLGAAAVAYWILLASIRRQPSARHFDEVFGRDWKGTLSIVGYVVGIALCFVQSWLGVVVYALVALVWLIPDRRVERWLRERHELAAG